jgi:hypothetical protein
MFYNQGTDRLPTINKEGGFVLYGAVEADANHYWADYITIDGDFVFTTTFVFESHDLYLEMNESILAGEFVGIMGGPACIEEGHTGFVHNPSGMFVDYFAVKN